jgi:site-specific recombinase XerD
MNIYLRTSTRRMIEQSPAATETWSFIEWLRTERYTDYTIDCHVRRLLFVMPRLSPGTSPPVLRHSKLVDVFGRERRPRSRFDCFAGTRRAYTRYLIAQGRLVREREAPNEDIVRRYDQYLIDVRGLSVSARCHHELTLRVLLASIRSRHRSLKSLSRDDVEQLILERSRRVSRHTLQHEVAQLRAFLRYAHDTGLIRERLDGFDTPRTYRGELPPRALPWPSVLQLLQSIKCTDHTGWRDLCILHLIAYYGLRPSEVVALRLDSIDWERELLQVHQSKTASRLTLPLAEHTLRLLRAYLKDGRPANASDTPMLFIRARCPWIPLERTATGDIFRKRMREAGLQDCGKHVYRLRHTFAMRLLARGVGMKAIGDVLGHHSFYGTSAYLRLDVTMLRGVALSVPSVTGGRHA